MQWPAAGSPDSGGCHPASTAAPAQSCAHLVPSPWGGTSAPAGYTRGVCVSTQPGATRVRGLRVTMEAVVLDCRTGSCAPRLYPRPRSRLQSLSSAARVQCTCSRGCKIPGSRPRFPITDTHRKASHGPGRQKKHDQRSGQMQSLVSTQPSGVFNATPCMPGVRPVAAI